MISLSAKAKKLIPAKIETPGPYQSIRLFRMEDMTYSEANLAKLLKKIKYEPKNNKDATEGFEDAVVDGRAVVCSFKAGFKVSVFQFKDGVREKRASYVSEEKATIIIKFRPKTVEVRGSDRIARRFRRILQDETAASLTTLALSEGGAKTLYDAIAIPDASKKPRIDYVLLADMDESKTNVSRIEFKGEDIQGEKDLRTWTMSYKGHISRFGGMIEYKSGAKLKTIINTEGGSLVVYKTEEGLADKDLRWIVRQYEDAAK
jgi:hypothetical protein